MTKRQSGFTLIELMIATAVFSVILLICSAALLQIGRTYYKGLVTVRTQEVAREVMTTLTEAIQFSGDTVIVLSSNGASEGYCIDNRRISYLPGNLLDDDPSDHALVIDDLNQSGLICNSGLLPQPLHDGGAAIVGREQLRPQMRVVTLDIEPRVNNLYKVSLVLATGTDDLLVENSGKYSCSSGIGTQFCAVTTLTSIVQKRVE